MPVLPSLTIQIDLLVYPALSLTVLTAMLTNACVTTFFFSTSESHKISFGFLHAFLIV